MKVDRLNYAGGVFLLTCLALALVLFAKPTQAHAEDGALSDLGATITINGSELDLSKATRDTSRTDGLFYTLLDVGGNGKISVDSINTTESSDGYSWSLKSVYNGRAGEKGMYCYLRFEYTDKIGRRDNIIGIQLGGYSNQTVCFGTKSPISPAEADISWPDGYEPGNASVSDLSSVNVQFWNLMNSTKFTPSGFNPAKSCNVTVSGYSAPYVGPNLPISDFSKYVSSIVPDGWYATGNSVNNSDGTTTYTCKVEAVGDSNVSVAWKFTYNTKLPCADSESITDDGFYQRANIALYQGSNKILWYETDSWAQHTSDKIFKGANVEVKSNSNTDLWYLGAAWVSQAGYVVPSGWLNSKGETCTYDDPDATKYQWWMISKDTGNSYGKDFDASLEKAIIRLAGSDCYGTNLETIRQDVEENGVPNGVIVCNTGHFVDSLSAAALSGLLDYPILLVDGTSNSITNQNTLEALDLLTSSNSKKLDVVILGGSAAISDGIKSQLDKMDSNGECERIWGADGYETNLAVYEYGKTKGSWNANEALIATGSSYYDALGAGSYAAATKTFIFLANPSDSNKKMVANAAKHGNATILGGTAAISQDLQNSLDSAGTKTNRFGGEDAYKTNTAFVEYAIEQGLAFDGCGFSTGTGYYDSLGSSHILGASGSVMLLVHPYEPLNNDAINLTGANKQEITGCKIFGGTAAVTSSTEERITNSLS